MSARPETFSGRLASQMTEELDGLIGLMKSRGVRSYLEVGARHGDTFIHVMRSLPHGSTGVAVDLPGGLWGKKTSRHALDKAVATLNAEGYGASAIYGDSASSAVLRLIKQRGPYDAILIDGDHTLEGVTRDWQNLGSCAPLVAFHDIVGQDQVEKRTGSPVEVPILWKTLKDRGLTVMEFVAQNSSMGIGVILQ